MLIITFFYEAIIASLFFETRNITEVYELWAKFQASETICRNSAGNLAVLINSTQNDYIAE